MQRTEKGAVYTITRQLLVNKFEILCVPIWLLVHGNHMSCLVQHQLEISQMSISQLVHFSKCLIIFVKLTNLMTYSYLSDPVGCLDLSNNTNTAAFINTILVLYVGGHYLPVRGGGEGCKYGVDIKHGLAGFCDICVPPHLHYPGLFDKP